MPEHERATSSRTAIHRRRATVLVVADDETTRFGMCLSLRRAGYAAIPARQGVEAHWCVERHEAAVDLIVTDLLPPIPDGYHLGIPFSRLHPKTPILFISPLSREMNIRRGLLHRDAPFVRTPCSPAALVRRVDEVLARWKVPPAA